MSDFEPLIMWPLGFCLIDSKSEIEMIKTLVFSKDRALQLQGTLNSFYLHCQDASQTTIFVIYTCSSETYRKQYKKLEELYLERGNLFLIQEQSFRPTVLEILNPFVQGHLLYKIYQLILRLHPSFNKMLDLGGWLIKQNQTLFRDNQILFLVDDNLFIRDFSLTEAVQTLRQQPKALGFSLRLGRNTNFSYMANAPQNLPEFETVSSDGKILKFRWESGEYDFGYPLEVSSSIYRLKELLPLVLGIRFINPSLLEGHLALRANQFQEPFPELLCYKESVTFCNPINLVQNVSANRAGSSVSLSTQTLARLFDEGYSVDVEKYIGFTPNSCHQEVELILKKQDQQV